MPIYEYRATDGHKACAKCRTSFEVMQGIHDAPLERCPDCGQSVRRVLSAPSVGASKSGFDDRAKSAGFHKLKKVSKGEYEAEY